jgi:hypothetical protein
MTSLSRARCLAISLVGALFGWWASVDDLATMAHYRTLSHDALIAELAQQNDGQVSTGIMGGLFVVLAVVLFVDALTRFFEAVWRRIELPREPNPTLPPAA